MFKKIINGSVLILFMAISLAGANFASANSVSTPDSTAYLTIGRTNPISNINYVDVNIGAQGVNILGFDINTPMKVYSKQIIMIPEITGSSPTGYHLFKATKELAFMPASSTVIFDNLTEANAGLDAYSIKADYGPNTSNGSSLKATISSVIMQNKDGQTFGATGTAVGNTQFFYNATPQIEFLSSDYFQHLDDNGKTVYIQTDFSFNVTPKPGSQIAPVITDYTLLAENSDGTNFTITNKGMTISPAPVNGMLEAGQTYHITLTGIYALPPPGTYLFVVTAASSTVQDSNGNWVNIFQTVGLDDFVAGPVTVE